MSRRFDDLIGKLVRGRHEQMDRLLELERPAREEQWRRLEMLVRARSKLFDNTPSPLAQGRAGEGGKE